MVELYWPRNTTFSRSTESGVDQYKPGLHDIDDERAEQFKSRGWLDPSDDDVDVEIKDGEDETETVDIAMNDGQDEEVELDEDELSLSADGPDLEDDTDDTTAAEREAAAEEDDGDEFDAESFVDRTPQQDVIDDIESGEYDDQLDEIAEAEEKDRDRRGVASAVENRRDES